MTDRVSNSLYYILKIIKLVTLCVVINSDSFKKSFGELLTLCVFNSKNWRITGRVLKTDSLREMAFYFIDHGAATAPILTHRLNLHERTVWRNLKALLQWGIIVRAATLPKRVVAKGGPRPVIYQAPDATVDQLSEAASLHLKLASPKYRVAEAIAQTILEDFILKRPTMEITYREIVYQVKKLRIPFNTPDIADLTARYLHEKGVRIWR